jgi:uncharacterized membrane protein YidH (DUF202 family)
MILETEIILQTIAYALIIFGMLLIAPKFFSAGTDTAENHHHHKFGFVLSWFAILAGLIISIIAVWLR